jgi:hypothetical protein
LRPGLELQNALHGLFGLRPRDRASLVLAFILLARSSRLLGLLLGGFIGESVLTLGSEQDIGWISKFVFPKGKRGTSSGPTPRSIR